MKRQILSLIFVFIASISFSQPWYAKLTKTSNLTPIDIIWDSTYVVTVGDSVWISELTNLTSPGYICILYTEYNNTILSTDTITSGPTAKYRFKILNTNKYKYVIGLNYNPLNRLVVFYIQGTAPSTVTNTGIKNSTETVTKLNVFPNPAVEDLTMTFNTIDRDAKIEIFDIHGRIVSEDNQERVIGDNTVRLDVSQLIPGFYNARVGPQIFRFSKME